MRGRRDTGRGNHCAEALEPDCCGPEADEMLGGLEPASKVKIAGLSSKGRQWARSYRVL